MSLSWINHHVDGVIEYCHSKDILDIYSALCIGIIKTFREDPVLKGHEAIYIRSCFGIEVVFIRDDLPYKYEKFILAHELGHAILHTDIASMAYNNKLLNKGKFERQADYFAFRLLNIDIDRISYEGYTCEQIAKDLCVAEESLEYIGNFFLAL